MRNSEDKDNSEAKLEVAYSHQRLCHDDIDCMSEPSNSSSQSWRCGPNVTSEVLSVGSVGSVHTLNKNPV